MSIKYPILFLAIILSISFGVPHSAWATCSSGQTTPPAPTSISADSSSDRIDVNYLAPPNAGGGSLVGYYISRELSTQTTFVEQPFSSSPLSYWKFDGCSTGLNDYGSMGSASNLQSSVTSPIYDSVNGKIAQAVKLDGSTTWFTSSSSAYSFQNNQPFSVSFWMKTNTAGHNLLNNNAILISKSYSSASGQGWSVWLQGYTDTNPGGYVNFDMSDGTHEIRVRTWNNNLFDNTNFYHITVTYDGSSTASGMRIYVNGAPSGNVIVSSSLGIINYVTPLQIGSLPLSNSNAFSGWIDDLRIYNTQLSQIQINDIVNLNFIASTGPLCPVTAAGTPPSCPQRTFPDASAQSVGQQYRVCPVNQFGQGSCLTSTSAAPNGLPVAPINAQITPGSTPPTTTWTAPASATGYYITRKAGSDSTFGEQPFSSRPLSYWKFDGVVTGLRDYGSLANNLQSSVTPATYDTAGQIGGAVKLDGSTNYFVAPNEFNYDFLTNQPFAISFWIKTTTPGHNLLNNNVDIISKVHGGYLDNQGWNVWLQGYTDTSTAGAIVFDISDGINEIKLRTWYNTLFDTTFHHVIVTYDGTGSSSGLTVIIDGQSTSGSVGTNLRDDNFHDTILNNDAVTIGALSTSNTNKFTGELDDMRIYNSPLNTQQISDLNSYTSIVTATSFTDSSNPTNPAYKIYAINQYGQGPASSTASTGSTVDVKFDQPSYLINHGALITVTDPNANLKESVADTIYVSVQDSSNAQTIRIPLTETGPNTNTFDNSQNLLVLSSSSTTNSIPALQVNPQDSVTVTYLEKSATSTIMNTPSPGTPPDMPTESFTKILCGASPDIDQDGICDSWENSPGGISGLTIPTSDGLYQYRLACGSGQIDSTCPDPSMKDVYVQIDWMAGHVPSQSAINAIVNKFAVHNIRLHVILGEQLPFHYDTIYWSQDIVNGNFVPSFQDIKQQYFLLPSEKTCPPNLTPSQCTTYQQDMYNAKSQVFHYALFVHNLDVTGQSGEGEIYGNDFAVSLGSFVNGVGSPDDQAGTFMHELGHNLDLNHGGPILINNNPTTDSSTNCKPNYLSIMSYARQFSSFIFDRPVDFSDDALPNLNEVTGLVESAGIGDQHASGQKTVYGGLNTVTGQPFNPVTIVARTNNSPLDFNRDPSNTAPNQNIHWINIPGCQDTTPRNLQGYDDWSNLGYFFTNSAATITGAPTDSNTPASNDETTKETVKKMRSITITSIQSEAGKLP